MGCTEGGTTRATPLNTVTPTAAGLAHPSDSKTGLAAGDYNFMAVVAGDSNYVGATSYCEPFTTGNSNLSLHDALPIYTPDVALVGNLPLNGGAHDSASVTGKVNGFAL